MLGHELRNPLAPIVTALDLMRLGGAGVLEQERAIIERQVAASRPAGRRSARRVADRRAAACGWSAPDRARRSWSPTPSRRPSPLVEERNQKLTVSVPAAGLVVNADRGRLAQVVTNLLTNAAKYTPAGGHVTVSARADGDQITARGRRRRRGHRPGPLAADLRSVHPGAAGARSKTGGPRTRARHRPTARRGTRRDHRSPQRGPRPGHDVIVRLPRARAALDEGGVSRVRWRTQCRDTPRAACSSSTTTPTRPHPREGDRRSGARGAHGRRRSERAPARRDLRARHRPARHRSPGDGWVRASGLLRRIPSLSRTSLVALTGYAGDGDRQRSLASGFSEHFAKPLPLSRVLECIDRLARRAD